MLPHTADFEFVTSTYKRILSNLYEGRILRYVVQKQPCCSCGNYILTWQAGIERQAVIVSQVVIEIQVVIESQAAQFKKAISELSEVFSLLFPD